MVSYYFFYGSWLCLHSTIIMYYIIIVGIQLWFSQFTQCNFLKLTVVEEDYIYIAVNVQCASYNYNNLYGHSSVYRLY